MEFIHHFPLEGRCSPMLQESKASSRVMNKKHDHFEHPAFLLPPVPYTEYDAI